MRASRWYALAGLLPGLTALWAKSHWMDLRGYRVVARALGRQAQESLTLLERVDFLRRDALLALVILPALALLVARLLPPRWRAPVVGALGIVIGLAFYVQVKAQDSVGSFLRWPLLVAAAKFGLQRPDYVDAYVKPGGLLKIGVVLVLTGVAAWWARRRDRVEPPQQLADVVRPVGAIVLAAALGWAPIGGHTRFHHAMIGEALTAYVRPAPGTRGGTWTPDSLLGRYHALAQVERSPRDPRWFGKAKDFDVLVYILETTPLRCVDSARLQDRLPNLVEVRAHAIAGRDHYTTFPYTSLALFSLFGGWYPPQPGQAFMERHPQAALPGLIRQLRAHGYASAIYAAYRSRFEDDPRLFSALGFEQQYYVDPTPTPSAGFGSTAMGDSTAMMRMQQDMRRWIAAGRRYIAVFHPEIGHAPWPVPDRRNPNARMIERCRALMVRQDAWLGGFRDLLRETGRLDRTLIVITGDHGIRTRQEDPSFEGGNLDRYSFRVPFILGSPALTDSVVEIRAVTSHVDVAPTLLDLLGVEDGRRFEQGLPVWDPAVARRTTFFFAGEYLGADGFYRGGRFYSYQRALDLVWSAPLLRFDSRDVVPATDPRRDSVMTLLSEMGELQQAWLATLAEGAAVDTARAPAAPVMRRDSSR